jgi:hypothetical protein
MSMITQKSRRILGKRRQTSFVLGIAHESANHFQFGSPRKQKEMAFPYNGNLNNQHKTFFSRPGLQMRSSISSISQQKFVASFGTLVQYYAVTRTAAVGQCAAYGHLFTPNCTSEMFVRRSLRRIARE